MFNSDNSTLYNKNNESFANPFSSGRGMYYWAAVVRDGKVFILGYRGSYDSAYNDFTQQVPGETLEIYAFDSKDIHKVSGKIKSKLLDKYHDLDKATQRLILKQSEQIKAKKKKTFDNEWAEY